MSQTLTVNEIFLSLQGEGLRTGRPCAFVRLTGCNLRCQWCDTTYAYHDGTEMSVGDILTRVTEQACPLVEVTGGEPLTQPQTPALLRRLCDAGFETLLETNGSLDISQLDPRVVRIVDFKCPASGHHDMNLWSNADSLTERDEVKFVITDRDDYQFARTAIADYNLSSRCPITFSPAHTLLDPAELAAWILTDQLPVRMGLGLHKLLWPDRNRGV